MTLKRNLKEFKSCLRMEIANYTTSVRGTASCHLLLSCIISKCCAVRLTRHSR
ncbi:hypothetical protein AHAS_Ahas10G0146300 [Arachis hypogaea]